MRGWRFEDSALRERAARLATANQRFAERTRDAQRGERKQGSASPYPRQTNVWRGRLIWRGLRGTRLREGFSPTRAEDSALRERIARLATANQRFAERTRPAESGVSEHTEGSPRPLHKLLPAPGKFSLKENHEKHKKTNNLTWLLVPHFLF